MTREDAVSLIRAGVGTTGSTWADLGAGRGVFAHALSELLGPAGAVIAVDRDARALGRIATPPASGAAIRTYHADFIRPLELPDLDGILLANSLHFVLRQERVLKRLVSYLKPQGQVLVVEYDNEHRSPWNPYPSPFKRFRQLAGTVGLRDVQELNRRPLLFGGREQHVAGCPQTLGR